MKIKLNKLEASDLLYYLLGRHFTFEKEVREILKDLKNGDKIVMFAGIDYIYED